jgi:hypothetical protein
MSSNVLATPRRSGHSLSGFPTVSLHLDDVAFQTNCSFGSYERSLKWIGHVKRMLAKWSLLYLKYSVLLIDYHATLFLYTAVGLSVRRISRAYLFFFFNGSRSLSTRNGSLLWMECRVRSDARRSAPVLPERREFQVILMELIKLSSTNAVSTVVVSVQIFGYINTVCSQIWLYWCIGQ